MAHLLSNHSPTRHRVDAHPTYGSTVHSDDSKHCSVSDSHIYVCFLRGTTCAPSFDKVLLLPLCINFTTLLAVDMYLFRNEPELHCRLIRSSYLPVHVCRSSSHRELTIPGINPCATQPRPDTRLIIDQHIEQLCKHRSIDVRYALCVWWLAITHMLFT